MSCYASVDAIDCIINEPTPWSPTWYSHKFKHAALRYEIALSLRGQIVWVNGPFPAGTFSDLKIFRIDLKNKLNEDELIIADRTYRDPKCKNPYNTSLLFAHTAGSFRAQHEAVNGRLKSFNVLFNEFRHCITKHGMCFYAVANLCQMALEESPVFSLPV